MPDARIAARQDHLKGSLMLSLENTAAACRMRGGIRFNRQVGLDETLEGVERVTTADVQQVATDLFPERLDDRATVLGNDERFADSTRATPIYNGVPIHTRQRAVRRITPDGALHAGFARRLVVPRCRRVSSPAGILGDRYTT